MQLHVQPQKGWQPLKKVARGEGTLKMIISIVELLLVNNINMQNSRFLNGKYLLFQKYMNTMEPINQWILFLHFLI